MSKLMKSCGLIAFALAWSGSAYAEVWCNGTLSASWSQIDGGVYIQGSWHPTHTKICSLNSVWKGVPPEVCASWLAKADAAVSLGRTVTVYYGGTFSDCATLPAYDDAPAPTYVMLR